jgi:hypothetical protein
MKSLRLAKLILSENRDLEGPRGGSARGCEGTDLWLDLLPERGNRDGPPGGARRIGRSIPQ